MRIVFLPDAGSQNPFQYQIIHFLKSEGVEVVSGKNWRLGSTLFALLKYKPDKFYYDWVHRYILGRTIVASLVKSAAFVIEIYILKLAGIPIIHTAHNLQNHAGRFLWIERRVYGWFLKQCSCIRVYSEASGKDVSLKFGLSPQKIVVAPDPSYSLHYPNTSDRYTSRNKLGIPQHQFVYLYFGGIRPYKGVTQLLEVFSNAYFNQHLLLIAGKCTEPDLAVQLQQTTGNRVNVRWDNRFIPVEEVQYYFNSADCVVLPFVRIDHSGTVDLAMNFGKTIITRRTAAHAELLAGQDDLLFDDLDELAILLSRCPQMPLEPMGVQNRQSVQPTSPRALFSFFVSR